MTTTSTADQYVRSFIAIELPLPVTELLAAMQEELRGALGPAARAIKWTRPEGTHLTLQFLGDVPASRISQIGEAISRACRRTIGPIALEVQGSIGAFPNPRRPRVIWVELRGSEADLARLHALRAAVEHELKPLGYTADKHFSPHLTLGRVREGTSPADLQALVALFSRRDERPRAGGTFPVTGLSLMKSELNPGGSIYTQLAHVELKVEG